MKFVDIGIQKVGCIMFSECIESERIILRDVTEEDANIVYSIWSNPENDKYMSDPITSLQEVKDICRERTEDMDRLTVVILKETGELIGTCCFGKTSGDAEWGFGYSISKPYWGKGYATEIVQTIIDFGMSLGIMNYASSCAEENVASARVLEKCGMTLAYKSSFLQPSLNIEYISSVYKLNK